MCARWGRIVAALLAFFSFGLAASATYIVNDLLDLEADRHHPRKRRRPFAVGRSFADRGRGDRGDLSLPCRWQLLCFLPRVAVALSPQFAWTGQGDFLEWLIVYAISTTAYSLRLKRMVLVDVIVLSGLYTIRILAGSAASGVPVSPWLAAFSIFFFLSLAFVKRFSELEGLRMRERGRGDDCGEGPRISRLRPGAAAQLWHRQRICSVMVFAAVYRQTEVRRKPVSAHTRACGCWFRCCCCG